MSVAMVDVDWSAALCAQVDPDLWFPVKGGSNKAALAGCKVCPLTGLDGPCMRAALAEPEPPMGVRAGLAGKPLQKLWTAANGDSRCPDCGTAVVSHGGALASHRRRTGCGVAA